MIVVFHILYYVANIIWNKVKPKLLSLEEDKKIPGQSKNALYALEKPEGDLDNSEEFDNYDPNKDVCVYDQLSGKLTFVPPLYIQRYKAVVNVLTQEEHAGKIHTVVEYGCAEFSMLKYYKNVPGVSEVLFVDIDEELLVTKCDRVVPLSYDHLMQRENELSVQLYCGDVSIPDDRMQEADVVVAIELIEHLHPPTLEAVPYNLFGFIQPPLVIITTPNGEFNHLFDDYVEGTFRHDDHKFEWSRKQFRSWAENIVTRYPMYSVQISGIGPPPQDKSEEQYGHCSQMAVFTRIGPKVPQIFQHVPQLDPAVSTPYKLIREVVYPQKPPDTRSPEAILFDEMTYLLFSWQQDLVSLSKLYEHLSPWCSSVEDLRETLKRNCRRMVFNKEEQEWYLVDDSRSDLLHLSDTEEEEQEALVYTQEDGVDTGTSHAVDNSWDTWDEPASSTGIREEATEHSGTLGEDNLKSEEETKVPENTVDRKETTQMRKTVDPVGETKSPIEEKANLVEETVVKKKKVNFLVETDRDSLNSTKERADEQHCTEPTYILSSSKSAVSEDTSKEMTQSLQTNQETNFPSNSASSMFSQGKTPPKNAVEKDSSNSEVRELLNYLLTSKLSKLKTEEMKTASTPATPISSKTNVSVNSQTTELNIKDIERTETGSEQPISIVFRNEVTLTPTDKIIDQTNSLYHSPCHTKLSSSTNNNWNTEDKNQEDRGKIRSSNLEQYIRDNLESGLDKSREESVINDAANHTGVNETIDADMSYDVTNGTISSNFEVSNNSLIDNTNSDIITDADSNRYDVTNDADVDTSDDEEQSARDEKVRHLSQEMSKVEAEIEKLKRDEAHPVLSTNKEKNIEDELTKNKIKALGERKLIKEGFLEQNLSPDDSFVVDSQNSAMLNSNSDYFPSDLSHSNFPAHSSTLETTSSSEFDSSLNLSSILIDTTRSNSGTDLVVSYNLKAQVTEYDSSVDDLENRVGNSSHVNEESETVKETSIKGASHILNQNDVVDVNNQGEILKYQKDNIGKNKVVANESTKFSPGTFHDIPDVLESALASTIVQSSSHKTDKLRDITNENSQKVLLQSERKVTDTTDVFVRKIEKNLESEPSQERVWIKDKAAELNSSEASGLTEATSGAQTNLNREINNLQTKLENLTLYSPERAGRISEWVNQVNHSTGQEPTKRRRRSLKLDSVENETPDRTVDNIPLQDEVPIISRRENSGQSYLGSKVPDLLKTDKSVSEETSKTANKNTPKYTFDVIVRDIQYGKNGDETVDGKLLTEESDVAKLEMRKSKDRIDVTKRNLQNPDIASGTGSGDQNEENFSGDEESDVEDYMSCAETTTGSFHTVRSDARSNGSDSLSMYSCGDAQFETASEYQSSYYSMSSDSDSDDTLVESDHDETFHPSSVIHDDDD